MASRIKFTVDAPKRAVKQPSKRVAELARKHYWSHIGVWMCVLMSAGLNGYANAQHSPSPLAGWMLGIMIPCLVFVLAKVAGMQHKGRAYVLARFTACMGLALLCLSVWHCACSLAVLTGSHIMLALPMAIAIDGGLVACELDLVLA